MASTLRKRLDLVRGSSIREVRSRTRRQIGRTIRSLSITVGDLGGPSIEIIRQARSGLCALRSTVPCRSGFTSVVECASVTR